jgi:uncharacterized membrane protein YjfL (UPF0719 family)
MDDSNLLSVVAGLLAYGVAVVLGTGPLIYIAFRLDTALTRKINEEEEMQQGNRSIAIELGTTILCQAILARHAVYAFMAMIRALFIENLKGIEIFWLLLRSMGFIAVILIFSLGSIHVAGKIFKKMMKLMKNVNIAESINRNNVAMAIFYALVLIAITIVLNEGMADFSRSLIPYGRAGIVSLE